MSSMTSVASSQANSPHAALSRAAIVGIKLAVTAVCFWYLQREVNVAATALLFRELNLTWFCAAALVFWLQIPLAGLRLGRIFDVLGRRTTPAPVGLMTAISAIGILFFQLLPSIVGEGTRAWLLVRAGSGWRLALMSVAADRAIGAITLFALSFVILLFPSALATLGGHRELVLVALGSILLVSLVAVAVSANLSGFLERRPFTRQLAPLADAARRLLTTRAIVFILGVAVGIHGMTALAIGLLAIAQGLALPIGDAAALFALMTTISVIPITVNGWGLRELAVTALLQQHGISAEHALFFSICFGVAMTTSAVPGAIVWLLYSPEQRKSLRR
jgi:uncharacterized membrane protein YbhN (UPF0104 family)